MRFDRSTATVPMCRQGTRMGGTDLERAGRYSGFGARGLHGGLHRTDTFEELRPVDLAVVDKRVACNGRPSRSVSAARRVPGQQARISMKSVSVPTPPLLLKNTETALPALGTIVVPAASLMNWPPCHAPGAATATQSLTLDAKVTV
jgi:hypothetical protein